MYRVEWQGAAREDLFAIVQSEEVARELLEVAKVALNDHHPPDGDEIPPWYWRRGITPRRRAELVAAEARGEVVDDGREHAWDYVLFYKRQPCGKPGGCYRVLAVRHNSQLLATMWALAGPEVKQHVH